MSRKKKHHALKKESLLPYLRWRSDFDYLHKLSAKELAWLNKFADEFIVGNVKKGAPGALHNTDELRKDCYRRKNLANRDLLSRIKPAELTELTPPKHDDTPKRFILPKGRKRHTKNL